jgi:hypothetical protein
MMKHLKWMLALVSPALMLSFSFENSNGKAGHTGSPGEQTCARSGCHDTYALNTGPGSISINVVGAANNTYVAGQTYEVNVTIAQSGSNLFGFNVEALQPSGNNAGTLNTGVGSQAINVTVGANVRRNLTHTLAAGASSNQHTFSFTWTAPTDGSDVTFYVAGNAANSNGSDSGDRVYTTTLNLSEAIPVVSPEIAASATQICVGQSTTLYTTPQDGVTIQWLNDQNQVVGTGDQLIIAPGTSGCYTAQAVAGAQTAASNAVCIQVDTPSDASFSELPATLCSNATPIIVLPANDGGSFTGLNSSNAFDPSQGPGTYVITYTIQSGVCESTSEQSIVVNAAPNAAFGGLNEAYCSNEDAAQGIPIEAGGVFSGSGISSNGLFNPMLANLGPNEIVYTIANSAGCSESSVFTVFVYDTLNATFTELPDITCSQSAPIVLEPVNPGGVFIGSGVESETWSPSLAGVGQHIIVYDLNLGQCSESSSDTVTVLASPDPELGPLPDTLCGFDFFPFPIVSFNAQTIISGAAVVNGVFMPDMAQLGYNYVTAELTGDNGCVGSFQDSLFIQSVPDAVLSISPNGQLEASAGGQNYVWVNCANGEVIAESASNTFEPLASGNYQVLIQDGLCGAYSNCVEFSVSSVSEGNASSVALYPNPGADVMVIRLHGAAHIQVFNALGARMESIQAQGQVELPTSNWPSGMYHVLVTDEKGRIHTLPWLK